jgi:hypothetical protein
MLGIVSVNVGQKSYNQTKLADLQSKTNRFLDRGIAISGWDKDQRHQEKLDYNEIPLDSGSRPPHADSSGMTASAVCDPAPWSGGVCSVV